MTGAILVVEDDRNLQELLVESLEDLGHRAQGACGSAEALELAKKVQFQLLITDIRMAGVDGIEGFRLLKRIHPDLKCIAITGYADDDVPARAIKIQIDDYLKKPFKLEEMQKVVNRVLDSQSIAAHYYKIIQNAPTKLFLAAARLFKKDGLEALDHSRNQVFQGVYVAIRSELIPVDSANGVFCKLIAYDQQYKEHLAYPKNKSAADLKQSYDDLFEFLAAMSRTHAHMIGGERLPPKEFRPIYNAVQSGEITPEQLKLAPTLKLVSPAELGNTPELLNLRLKLWGETF